MTTLQTNYAGWWAGRCKRCWVIRMAGKGGTDLDTTELHQHNDQSTQSRPKPEGSGRRRMVCYKQQKQKAECSKWKSKVWQPDHVRGRKKERKKEHSIFKLSYFIFIGNMKNLRRRGSTERQTSGNRQRHCDLHRRIWMTEKYSSTHTTSVSNDDQVKSWRQKQTSTEGHMVHCCSSGGKPWKERSC